MIQSPQALENRLFEKGLLFVLSAPSGAGKTTVFQRLLDRFQDLAPSISATTRPPRPEEQEGVHYYFMTPQAFESQEKEGEFLESATVYTHRYGTPRDRVVQQLSRGFDVLFDVDWQGAQALKGTWEPSDHVITICLLPPSLAALEARLVGRGTDLPSVIQARMASARHEIAQMNHYDYVVVNDHLPQAVEEAALIVQAERAQKSASRAAVDFSPEKEKALLAKVAPLRGHRQAALYQKILQNH